MATLVFSSLGTMLGGPLGGAVGSLVGRQLDTALFGTGRRQGPRLKELAVTSSTYGQPIARHFGRMRVAGTVIWATDLVEHSEVQGTGKGGPSVTTYSYTANFAVALASRPILGLGRIWADGKLLRGAQGDLKVGGTLRVHTGHGDQPPDSLIVAAEGESRCPAFRDLAYAVFEDLDLSEYYNRIPTLTFEVIADESFDLGDVIGSAIDEVSGAVEADVPLGGFAGYTSEGSAAVDLQTFEQVMPLEIDAGGERLVIARARLQGDTIVLPEPALAAGDDDFGAASGFVRRRGPAAAQPPAILRYYDLDRDYQPGAQRAAVRPGPGQPATIDLPAALDAPTARAIIEHAAHRADWSRETISWRTAELDPAVAPGGLVALSGLPGRWRVREWEWRETGVELALERAAPVSAATSLPIGTDPGRANPPADVAAAQTVLVAFELPRDASSGPATAARPVAAVSGTNSEWAGAALHADRGDGALVPLGSSGRTRAVIGTALSVMPEASPLLFDRGTQLTVALVDPAMTLACADTLALARGANLALVGNEIVQFASAAATGGGTWRLDGLLRGRGGTEAAIGSHGANEPFVLLAAGLVPLDPAVLGTAPARRVVATGRGDTEPVETAVLLDGLTLRPLAPVHPRLTIAANGDWTLSWTRRARGGWQWLDGVDVPLVEQAERYVVAVGPPHAPLATWITQEPRLELAAGTLSDLATLAPGAEIVVRQQGTHALSLALPLCTLP